MSNGINKRVSVSAAFYLSNLDEQQTAVTEFDEELVRRLIEKITVFDGHMTFEDALMQKIAIENNLSETAFVVWEDDHYHLRRFTPGKEVDLCGHATLGTAFVLANFYKPNEERFVFDTLSGRLIVTRKGDLYEMDYDFVSRTFFPKIKVNEDPVCGSAHCNFVPFWAKELGKAEMTAHQISPRGGIVYCRNDKDRVYLSGRAVLYSGAEIHI